MATDKKKKILGRLGNFPASFIHGNTQPKIFFLLLSIFLWFLIKLSKEGYVTQVDYPVVYEEMPSDKRLISDPPEEITLTIRGMGFSILKHKFRSLSPIAVNVAELDIPDTNRYRWDTKDKQEVLSAQFDEDIQILEIKPDAIYFDFRSVERIKMKVYLKGKKKYSNIKTMYRPPEIVPDSITISGTREQLAEIDSIFTEPLELKAEEDSVSHTVELALPEEEGLKFSHKEVRVNLVYSSLTEGTVEVPVEVVNPPTDYDLTLIPAKVQVTYRVPIRDFDKIEAKDFGAFVDYQAAKEKDSRLLEVEFSSMPTYVKKTRIRPKKVEFILTEK